MDKTLYHRVTAVRKMVRHEATCRVFNALPYITIYPYCRDDILLPHLLYTAPFITKNATYMSKSLLTHDSYFITTLHNIDCAPIYDSVSEIIFQILEERCSKITFPIFQGTESFNALSSTTPKCSSTAVGLSDGIYGRELTWIWGYQMNIQVSISHKLQHCTAREIYIMIKIDSLIGLKPGTFVDGQNIYIWKMEQDRFECTILDYAYGPVYIKDSEYSKMYYRLTKTHYRFIEKFYIPLGIKLYISVKRHSRNNVELHPDISSCNQTMHIEHQNKKVYDFNPRARKPTSIYLDERGYVHCLLSTCYFLYPFRTNASWNSAQTLCQQDGRQLLTVNSDIKAQFIDDILHNYNYLYFARHPPLFLNMKQDDKVCAIVLCVVYNEVFSL